MTTAVLEKARSLQRYVWSSPALAALLYPLALAALFRSATLVHQRAVGAGGAGLLVSRSLCLGAPAGALRVASLSRHAEAPSRPAVRRPPLGHPAGASPPLLIPI